MKRLCINGDYGGFGLSEKALDLLFQYKSIVPIKKKKFEEWVDIWIIVDGKEEYFDVRSISREDSDLIRVVEELGEMANSKYSSLRIIEIPDDVEYDIQEYDGWESVHEKHRVWR